MSRPYKAHNKRVIPRSGSGRFRQTTPEDFGRRFVYRCFTCSPLTEAEKALKAEIEASKPKTKTMEQMLEDVITQYGDE